MQRQGCAAHTNRLEGSCKWTMDSLCFLLVSFWNWRVFGDRKVLSVRTNTNKIYWKFSVNTVLVRASTLQKTEVFTTEIKRPWFLNSEQVCRVFWKSFLESGSGRYRKIKRSSHFLAVWYLLRQLSILLILFIIILARFHLSSID